MSVGPIEVIVVEFPGNRFNGKIIPELRKLVDAGTIRIVDGLMMSREEGDAITILEIDQVTGDTDLAALAELFDTMDALISDEDIESLSETLEPNSSAAILVFEHTWAIPFRDAVVDSGGILAAAIRIPADVVDDVIAALAAKDLTCSNRLSHEKEHHHEGTTHGPTGPGRHGSAHGGGRRYGDRGLGRRRPTSAGQG